MIGSETGIADLRTLLEQVLNQEASIFGLTVPRASHLLNKEETLDLSYYLRHRIETVHRIRETARTDALALATMVTEDYTAARKWANYTEQEMNHDRLYLTDLAKHGWTEEAVLAVVPFPSTQSMVKTLAHRITQFGSLPAIAYSIFVEWNSSKASDLVVDHVSAVLSEDHVKGARAHVAIDLKDCHYDTMLDVASSVLHARGYRVSLLEMLVREVAAFFRTYFYELHLYALYANSSNPAPSANGLMQCLHYELHAS
jgi:hypothetical protein